MDSIVVSVAVLAYNHEKYIKDALDSVLSQKVDFPFEIVIGEDKSPDTTREIVKEYQKRYPNMVRLVLHDKNVGGSENYYQVLKRCSGKYVAILEADDYWTDETKLQKQVNFLEQRPDFIAVSHIVEGKSVTGHAVEKYPPFQYWGRELLVKDFLKGYSLPLMGVLFRNTESLFKYWELVRKGPRNMGDFTISIGLLNEGRSYVMNSVMAVYTIKNSSAETNYNSIYNWQEKFANMLTIINVNTNYYKNKYDFSYWYSYSSVISFLHAFKNGKIAEFRQLYRQIPTGERVRLIKHIPYIFIVEVLKKTVRIMKKG